MKQKRRAEIEIGVEQKFFVHDWNGQNVGPF